MSTLFGMLTAFALVVVAIIADGDISAFINIESILIVVLGTVAVTAISFSFAEMFDLPKNIWILLRYSRHDPAEEAIRILELSAQARDAKDIRQLDALAAMAADRPFLRKAIEMATDGTSPEEIEQLMRREASTTSERHMRAVDFLRRAGDVAPAMGLIGTLIGLVKMLGNLENPAEIGPAMAIALLTTLYGALMAHLVFIPLAAKTEATRNEEALINNLYTMGATSIARKENPRRLEMLLNTILPPASQIEFFK